MMEKKLIAKQITDYKKYLENEEKSAATVEKYLRDVRAFFRFVGEQKITKALVAYDPADACGDRDPHLGIKVFYCGGCQG